MNEANVIVERINGPLGLGLLIGREGLEASARVIVINYEPAIAVDLAVPWGVLEPRRVALKRYMSSGVGKEQYDAARREYIDSPVYNKRAHDLLVYVRRLVRRHNYRNYKVFNSFDPKREQAEWRQIQKLLDAGERVIQIETVSG